MSRSTCAWPGCRLKPQEGSVRCSEHGMGLPDVLHVVLEHLAVATRLGHSPPEEFVDELRSVLQQTHLDEMASAAVPLVDWSARIKRTAERLHMEALVAGRVSSPSVLERDLLATYRFARNVEKRAAKIGGRS